MVRFEPGRNYYADLGLDYPSDEITIRKEYRKAALKHHPDRNIGNEEEAKAAFVVIQSAFDVLNDAQLKAKYDELYPQKFLGNHARFAAPSSGPSGVRGNPWQDYGKEYAPPPQRADRRSRQQPPPPPPPPQPSGSQRWQKWGTFRTPPTAKTADPNPENVFEAFNRMRPTARPPPPPPPPPRQERQEQPAPDMAPDGPPLPPRTASMRQRADAAFGNRRSGYYPHSPMTEDEPQVGSTKNYGTSRHTSDLFAETARRVRESNAGTFAGAAAAAAAAAGVAAAAGGGGVDGGGTGSAADDSHDERRDGYTYERRRGEYRSHGGEKYDPFDGRRQSVRGRRRRADPNESDTQSATGAPQRSSSLPRDETPSVPSSSHFNTEHDAERPRTTGRMPAEHSPDPFSSRGARSPPPPPRPTGFDSADESSTQGTPHNPSEGFGPGGVHFTVPQYSNSQSDLNDPSTASSRRASDTKGTPMYGRRHFSCVTPRQNRKAAAAAGVGLASANITPTANRKTGASYFPHMPSSGGTAGNRLGASPNTSVVASPSLTPFEFQQHSLLNHLLGRLTIGSPGFSDSPGASPFRDHAANQGSPSSFNYGANDGNAQKTTPHPSQAPFTDDIRFVNADDRSNSYQFSAGSTASSSSAERTGRHERLRTRRASRKSSPLKRPNISDDDDEETPSERDDGRTEAEQAARAFDPKKWIKEFDPQMFVPKPGDTKSTSPTRGPGPGHLRRVRSIRPTMGNAGLADDSTSDEGESGGNGKRGSRPDIAEANSPSAMDLDDEPPAAAAATPPPPPPPPPPHPTSSNGVRNIPVEPSRPDWRAGDAGAVGAEMGSTPQQTPIGPSEDSDEFRTTFADLRNVAPFAPEGTGLDSINDLKAGLPFETQPSARIPIPRKPVAKELPFPPVPQAPPPPMPLESPAKPARAMWEVYLRAFEAYMHQWDEFNESVVAHFAARAEERKAQGYMFLQTVGDGDIRDYTASVGQDIVVRQKWTAACTEHERRLREFMAFRTKMM